MPFLTIAEALRQGTQLLQDSGIAVPKLTAQVLLAHALQKDRTYLIAHSTDPLTELAWIHYGRYLDQRLRRVPTQYITKRQEFFGRDFHLTPDVLIPRPETEHLIEAALPLIHPHHTIADLGTGSGAIAITLALEAPAARYLALDLSAAALRVAAANAARHHAPIAFLHADLTIAFRPASLDLIVSNPPYISEPEYDTLQPEVKLHEPRLALTPGPTGLEIYARLIADAHRTLTPGGHLLLELGHDSREGVVKMLDAEGFENIEVQRDLAGIERVVRASKAGVSTIL